MAVTHHYSINTAGTDYLLGDLHGHYTLFMEELKRLKFDPKKDRVFSVGDLIDRGPESSQCLDLIYEPWFHSIQGNHENMLVASLNSNYEFTTWLHNGRVWSLDIPLPEHKQYAADIQAFMPYWMTVEMGRGTVGLVHASPPSDWNNIADTDLEMLIWDREKIKTRDATPILNIDYVICGHTPNSNGPIVLGNTAFIDCNIYRSGRVPLFTLDGVFPKKAPAA